MHLEAPVTTAIVVGSGPNGLAAAVHLAAAGVEVTVLEAKDVVGGGARSREAIVPGLVHDECAAMHPMAVESAFQDEHDLTGHGLTWLAPEIDLVHPLDAGRAGVLRRSVAETAGGLGVDGRPWRRLFEGPSASYDRLAEDILGPLLAFPRHPLTLARFGAPALLPATLLARQFRTPAARALWTGVAAHSFQPLHRPLTSAIGLGIITAGHHVGWVVAQGGTGSITDAMVARLEQYGGRIETGVRVASAADLPPADITMLDLTPEAAVDVLGDRLPSRVARSFSRFRHGPGVFKVDFAVQGHVPWTDPAARLAGTLHLVGDASETVAVSRDVAAGRMPDRPFVLVGQQYLADPSRSVGDVHPVYAYAHVPNGYSGDATALVVAQVERFAPGFRDCIVGMSVRNTSQMAAHNTNYVGGDILTGAKDVRQLVLGPRTGLSPYATGVPGTYLCSAATPPGPGVHGMCGFNAAKVALAQMR